MNDRKTKVEGQFSEKLLATLDRIEYRRIETYEDFEDVARIRYKAYKAGGVLPVSATKLIDDIDYDMNAHVLGMYYEEQLVSTLRIHHVTPENRCCQSIAIFPEAVNDLLDQGLDLIDAARFAIDPDFANERSAIPYLTVRPAIMAVIHFDADRMLQPIRPAHAAFYRRFFHAEQIAAPRQIPAYDFDLTLLASPTRQLRSSLMRRVPAFQSEAYERRMMFDDASRLDIPALTILPTARLAGRPTSPEMAFLH
jgi:hypothetical protein